MAVVDTGSCKRQLAVRRCASEASRWGVYSHTPIGRRECAGFLDGVYMLPYRLVELAVLHEELAALGQQLRRRLGAQVVGDEPQGLEEVGRETPVQRLVDAPAWGKGGW